MNYLHFNFINELGENEIKIVDKKWLELYWQGGAVVFWQAPKNNQGQLVDVINKDSDVKLLQWLENKLSEIQQRPKREIAEFDALLINQLQQFQRQYGMISDTNAKQRTLMLLSNTVSQGLPIFEIQ